MDIDIKMFNLSLGIFEVCTVGWKALKENQEIFGYFQYQQKFDHINLVIINFHTS